MFISSSAKGAGAALALSQFPLSLFANNPEFKDQPFGFQSFPIRDRLAKDFPGTLKIMEDMGYKQVEMCSPQGYAQIGFGPLVNMKTSDMRKIINDA